MDYCKNPDAKPELKGVKGGNCNRTACQMPHADWYNPYTYAYYCRCCAKELNRVWEGQPVMTKRCHIPDA